MAQPLTRPREPLVVVLGSTGTGKSDLAVELACRFNGEVINADAMQMYRGLPVTTNKISVAEQRGVPHHLLGTIALHERPWDVSLFRREASRIIQGIRDRGRLPIVVGGSQYYIDSLVFDDHLIEDGFESGEGGEANAADGNGDDGGDADVSARHERFPVLNASTETILAELRHVDPVMAARWHPNDRRKIQRSLEIFLATGRRASDIYAEQRRRRQEGKKPDQDASNEGTAWPCLFLWVYARPDVLDARLDARIDTMLERGLDAETAEVHGTLRAFAARGVPIDRTKGIWQSIGFKEMEPYVVARAAAGAAGASVDAADADTAALAALREAGLDGIKFGTRRYARYQLRWIKNKTIPYLADANALDRLFLLDGTDKAQWQATVADTGVRLTAAFLNNAEPLPPPASVSETAREVLQATIAASRGSLAEPGAPAYRQDCAICKATLLTEDQWNKHIRGSRHRRVLQKHKRRALVPVQAGEGYRPPTDGIAQDNEQPEPEQAAAVSL